MTVLVCLSVTVVKHWTKAVWGGRQGLLWFTIYSPSLREAEAGTETLEKHCSFSMVCSACFLI